MSTNLIERAFSEAAKIFTPGFGLLYGAILILLIALYLVVVNQGQEIQRLRQELRALRDKYRFD
jgi:hypothetical protein